MSVTIKKDYIQRILKIMEEFNSDEVVIDGDFETVSICDEYDGCYSTSKFKRLYITSDINGSYTVDGKSYEYTIEPNVVMSTIENNNGCTIDEIIDWDNWAKIEQKCDEKKCKNCVHYSRSMMHDEEHIGDCLKLRTGHMIHEDSNCVDERLFQEKSE